MLNITLIPSFKLNIQNTISLFCSSKKKEKTMIVRKNFLPNITGLRDIWGRDTLSLEFQEKNTRT